MIMSLIYGAVGLALAWFADHMPGGYASNLPGADHGWVWLKSLGLWLPFNEWGAQVAVYMGVTVFVSTFKALRFGVQVWPGKAS